MLIWMHQALDVVNNEVNKTMNKAEVLDYLSYAAAMVSCYLAGLWLCLPCSIFTCALKLMSCSSYLSLPSLIISLGTMVGPWEDLYKLMLAGHKQRVMIRNSRPCLCCGDGSFCHYFLCQWDFRNKSTKLF